MPVASTVALNSNVLAVDERMYLVCMSAVISLRLITDVGRSPFGFRNVTWWQQTWIIHWSLIQFNQSIISSICKVPFKQSSQGRLLGVSLHKQPSLKIWFELIMTDVSVFVMRWQSVLNLELAVTTADIYITKFIGNIHNCYNTYQYVDVWWIRKLQIQTHKLIH